jgi:hypothetical protein
MSFAGFVWVTTKSIPVKQAKHYAAHGRMLLLLEELQNKKWMMLICWNVK